MQCELSHLLLWGRFICTMRIIRVESGVNDPTLSSAYATAVNKEYSNSEPNVLLYNAKACVK